MDAQTGILLGLFTMDLPFPVHCFLRFPNTLLKSIPNFARLGIRANGSQELCSHIEIQICNHIRISLRIFGDIEHLQNCINLGRVFDLVIPVEFVYKLSNSRIHFLGAHTDVQPAHCQMIRERPNHLLFLTRREKSESFEIPQRNDCNCDILCIIVTGVELFQPLPEIRISGGKIARNTSNRCHGFNSRWANKIPPIKTKDRHTCQRFDPIIHIPSYQAFHFHFSFSFLFLFFY